MRTSLFVFLAFCSVTLNAQEVVKPGVWSQVSGLQPSVDSRGVASAGQQSQSARIPDAEFGRGDAAHWIWGRDENRVYTLSVAFDASAVETAQLKASCDNRATIRLNGQEIVESSEWNVPMWADVTNKLVEGQNTIQARVENDDGPSGFVFKLLLRTASGEYQSVVTDGRWTAQERNQETSEPVTVKAKYGAAPWGNVFDNDSADASGRMFTLLPDYQVERLFSVPKDELGSWVCIAFDDKGRLIASDQGGKGICRITPAEVDHGKKNPNTRTTIVERLDFSNCEYQPSGAQGILYAFDSLYFCCNGGPGSGLYRARDTNGDDQYDECVRLKQFRGGGEHGPHSLRLSPDGKRIFVIAGNHTDPPFKAGEDLTNEDFSSRIPTNWGEDLLLPRMWDANGHARGKLAPGGWIASTDPDGRTWDLWSIGYRNPYDMAFNADGELFAYDADMEWDVGSPWYRPTRVVHATSGSEFGWRSGTGKWPKYYIDGLPPMIDIGPGSPVGVDFGYGLKFPAKYQRALYICDWTFGTMYAVHIQPQNSSYTATKEEFVARTPLPLTDCAAGPDGALYFTIGGRGNQSELYRVTYAGDESTAPAKLKDTTLAQQRQHRHEKEASHGAVSGSPGQRPLSAEEFLETFDEDIVSKDRFLKTAVRNAFFNSTLFLADFGAEGIAEMAQSADDEPSEGYIGIDFDIGVVVSLARAPVNFFPAFRGHADKQKQWRQHARTLAVQTLLPVLKRTLSAEQKLNYLRAMSLAWIRLGEPDEDTAAKLVAGLNDWYPSDDARLNRELCQMLVYLNSETVVPKTVRLMNQPPQRDSVELGQLLTRNRRYGDAIQAMIDNQPDQQQVWFAFCLRVAKSGWTPDLRADYYRWFGRAQTWSGGNSFRKFLQNIENEAWTNTTFDHRILVEKQGARTPYKAPELPKPVGPGQAWTLEEVRAMAKDGLKNRSYENGKRTFAAARCILCHRFAGDGGATGPDLTQLAGRFNLDAMTEAILDPGKVISDQYRASSVVTNAGKVFNGRIVSETDDQISILTDPEDSTKIVNISKGDIEELLPSKVSLMPADLLKSLNRDEVLDLLAYLMSRGDSKAKMFRR